MKRFRRTLAGVLIAFVPAAAVAVPATSATAAQPLASLQGAQCQTALDPPARAIAVTAVMHSLPGTAKLQLEFQLLERATGATAWSSVAAPGFGTWLSPSTPTLGQRAGDVWRVSKPVAGLNAPASYRFEVSFRWLGSDGSVLDTTTRLGKVCRQPELRPDLTVQSISINTVRGQPNRQQYAAVISDTGLTGAGPFTVQLSQSGFVTTKTIQHISPGQSLIVRLLGPVCDPAAPATVTVDPNDQIDVYTRVQATLAAQCQAQSSSGQPGAGSGLANGIPVSN